MRSPLSILLALAALALSGSARAQPKSADPAAEAARVEQLRKKLGELDGRLLLIEKEYATRVDPGEVDAARHRFSDGEIQYLL
ncbi:MAG TPA: hypothetical protein VK433_11850, partial [Stellaceae bacterium]|nr:hypothetical protein [Stellaceae bacterium]